jgi:hypothetical protein
VGLGVQKFER